MKMIKKLVMVLMLTTGFVFAETVKYEYTDIEGNIETIQAFKETSDESMEDVMFIALAEEIANFKEEENYWILHLEGSIQEFYEAYIDSLSITRVICKLLENYDKVIARNNYRTVIISKDKSGNLNTKWIYSID